MRFDVRVVTRAARTEIAGQREGALVVRVTAPPVEGAANEAVIRALAGALGCSPSDLAMEAGRRGRRKSVSAPAAAADALLRLG